MNIKKATNAWLAANIGRIIFGGILYALGFLTGVVI